MQQGESTVINHKLASHLLGLKSLSSKVDYLWRLLETVAPAATSMHGHTTLNVLDLRLKPQAQIQKRVLKGNMDILCK